MLSCLLLLAGCANDGLLSAMHLGEEETVAVGASAPVGFSADASRATGASDTGVASRPPVMPRPRPSSTGAASAVRPRDGNEDAFSLAYLRRKIDAAFTPERPSPAERQKLGDELTRKVLADATSSRDARLKARLESIVRRLVAPAREESDFPATWRIHVIEADRADAFTSGGGHLFITRGMVDMLQTDERIATVLAHEMAHNLLAHVWDAKKKKDLARRANEFSREVLAGQMKMAWLGQSVSFLVRTSLNTYTRQQEYDADALGLHLLVRAGWRPQVALETFDHLRKFFRGDQGAIRNFFYSHHPLYERRRWYLANRIRAYYRQQAGLPPVRRTNWKNGE